MKNPVLAALVMFCSAASGTDYKTLKPEDLYNENRFRKALHKLEPELDAISYLFDGHIVFALFRKGESERYLLVLNPSPVGKFEISIAGEKQALPLKDPMVVEVAMAGYETDGSPSYDYDNTTSATIGHWLTIPNESKLVMSGTITHPAERVLDLAYEHPRKIEASLTLKKK